MNISDRDSVADGESEEQQFWMFLVLGDSALPTGAFISSGGLESFVQSGQVKTPADVENFVRNSMHNFASSQLPFIVQSFDLVASASYDDADLLEALASIDRELDAHLACNPVARRASASQGLAYATLLVESFGHWMVRPSLARAYKAAIRQGKWPHLEGPCDLFFSQDAVSTIIGRLSGHFAMSFGLACASLKLSLRKARFLALQGLVKALLSSAVRLGLFGPFQMSTMLMRARPWIAVVLNEDPVSIPATTFPVLELLQSQHDQLYTRMFNS